MVHWRKRRADPDRGGLIGVAFFVAIVAAYVLGLRLLTDQMIAPRQVVRQAPPYYECNGPVATRHPRCDRD